MKKLITFIIFLLISAVVIAQSVDGAFKTLTASGTDAYTISEAFPAAYDSKERFIITFTNANTGAATLNRNGLGAKDIKKPGNVALSAGDIAAGGRYIVSYNGTYYQIMGVAPSGVTTGTGTTNEIAYWTGASSLGTLPVATYPSLTELSYVKGLTSGVQTQIDGKQPLNSNLTSWAGITRASGFDTWVTTSSWTNFNSLITGTAPYWSLANGGTLTGNNTIAQDGFNTTFSGTGKVTFSPSATLAGINVGILAGGVDPSSPTNGDLWGFNSGAQLRLRVNATTGIVTWLTTNSAVDNRVPVLSSTSGGMVTSVNFTFNTSNSTLTTAGLITNTFTANTSAIVGHSVLVANTRFQVRGLGTTTGNLALFEDNAGTAKMELLDNGRLSLYGRLRLTQGADVASVAGAIAVGSDGNSFEITGTNAITLISNLNWQNGSTINLIFTSTASLTDGTANSGTDIGMELSGNTNFTGSADDIVTLMLCEIGGVQRWREVRRSVN